MIVSQAIKETAEKLGALYLRAVPSEANETIERHDLQGRFLVIYTNHPTVDYDITGGFTKANYPVQIQVLKLGDFDDNTEDSDILVDECRAFAETMALALLNYEEGIIFPDGFETDPFDTVQIYDSILTGVTLTLDINFQLVC